MFHPNRRFYSSIVIAIVLIAGAVGAFFYLNHDTTISQQIAQHPLMLGSFRYVNACQALPYSSYQQAFGHPVYVGASAEQDYAEDLSHIPASGDVASECDGGFAVSADTVMPVHLTLNEYKSAGDASDAYNTDVSLGGTPVPGLTNAQYDPDHTAVDVLLNNIELQMSFGNEIENVVPSQDQVIAYVKGALPIITANIGNSHLSQAPYDITTGQQKWGDSTYFNPCDYLSNQSFKDIFATDSDKSSLRLSFQYAAPQAAAAGKKSLSDTINTECERSNDSQDMDVLVKYYKTNAAALAGAKDEADVHVQAFDVKKVNAPTVGSYSIIQMNNAQQDDSKSDMVIAVKSYVINITLTTDTNSDTPKLPTTDQYEKAARAILASFPF